EYEKIENSRALDTTAYLSFFELLHNGPTAEHVTKQGGVRYYLVVIEYCTAPS
ncbi:unnamed protein product, partial [Ascophyllum nodosum]